MRAWLMWKTGSSATCSGQIWDTSSLIRSKYRGEVNGKWGWPLRHQTLSLRTGGAITPTWSTQGQLCPFASTFTSSELLVAQTPDCPVTEWVMKNELKNIWQKTAVVQLEAYFAWRDWGNPLQALERFVSLRPKFKLRTSRNTKHDCWQLDGRFNSLYIAGDGIALWEGLASVAALELTLLRGLVCTANRWQTVDMGVGALDSLLGPRETVNRTRLIVMKKPGVRTRQQKGMAVENMWFVSLGKLFPRSGYEGV